MLEGYVDIYLPDLKYKEARMSAAYSSAPDYFEAASQAVLEMYRQTGKAVYDEKGLIKKGLLIRHLVLPEGCLDSIAILEWINENLPVSEILVSIMNQYTPVYRSAEFEKINRPLTSHEYRKVTARAQKLGICGYVQDAGTERVEYIPPFDLQGV
ncbi:hypothetical protein SDC9_166099 [bioreactor metagenome]|uniref:Radical SAM C-terminal extension domain-containing protein n=1 Tax=bioreactor metagenome TaxID=1076179 RepID=A0A645FXX9_9ZZZZ